MKARLSRRHTAARVFGVELNSLLHSGEDQVPQVVRMCTAFVEKNGLVDGIYRLSGVASNTKRLREEFDAGRVPDLTRSVYMRDVHCVSSLCKQFFRDLPEPLLTYHLFHLFDEAVRAASVEERLQKIHHAIHQLPLPHYNTLEFLITHLSHMASHSAQTNMHAQNLAIVWAPNLLRSRGMEEGPVSGAAFLEVRVQSVVVETLLSHRQRLFCIIFQPSATRPCSDGLSTQTRSAAEEASSSSLPPPLVGEVASRSALRLVSLAEAQKVASCSHRALPEDLRTPPTLRRKHHHHQHHQHQLQRQGSQEQEQQQHQDHHPQQDQAANDHGHRFNVHQRAESVGCRPVCAGNDHQLDKDTKRKKGGLLSFFNRYTQSSWRKRKNSNASDSVQLRGYHGQRDSKQQHRLSQSTANLLADHDLAQLQAARRLTRSNSIGTLSNPGSPVTEILKEVDTESDEVKEPSFTPQNLTDGPSNGSTDLPSSLGDACPGQASENPSETPTAPSEPPVDTATDPAGCEGVSVDRTVACAQPAEQDPDRGHSEPLAPDVPKDESCVDSSVVNGEKILATSTSSLANAEIVREAAEQGTANGDDPKPRADTDGEKTEFEQPNGCAVISSDPSACDDGDRDDDDRGELVSAQKATGDRATGAVPPAGSPETGSGDTTCVTSTANEDPDSDAGSVTLATPVTPAAPVTPAHPSHEPPVSESRDATDGEGDAAPPGGGEGSESAPLGGTAGAPGRTGATNTETSDREAPADSGDETSDLEADCDAPRFPTPQKAADPARDPKTTADALPVRVAVSPEAPRDVASETGVVAGYKCVQPAVLADASVSADASNASASSESSIDASGATESANDVASSCDGTRDASGSTETNAGLSADTLPSPAVTVSASVPHEATLDASSAETAAEIESGCESGINPSPCPGVIIDTLPTFDVSSPITAPTELSDDTATEECTDTSAGAPSNQFTEGASEQTAEASTKTSLEAPSDSSTEASTETTEAPADTFTEEPSTKAAEAPSDTFAEAPSDSSTEASTETSEAPADTSTEEPSTKAAGAPSDTFAEAPSDSSTEALTETSEAPADTSTEEPSTKEAGAPSDTSAEAPSDQSTEAPTDTPEAPADTSAEAPTYPSSEAPIDTFTVTPPNRSFVTHVDMAMSSEATLDTSVTGESVQNTIISTKALHWTPLDEQCLDQLPTAADEVEVSLPNTDPSNIDEARISNSECPTVDLEVTKADSIFSTTSTNSLLDVPINPKIVGDTTPPGERPLPRAGDEVSARVPARSVCQGTSRRKLSRSLDLSSNRSEPTVGTDPRRVLKHLSLQEKSVPASERRRESWTTNSDSKNNRSGEPRTLGVEGNGDVGLASGEAGEEASRGPGEPLATDGVALQPADTELVRTCVTVRLSKAFPVVRSKPQFTSQLGSG